MFSSLFRWLSIASFLAVAHSFSIEKFDIIENDDSWNAAMHNSRVMLEAIHAASSPLATDRVVEIPAGKLYFMTNFTAEDVHNVGLQIDGTLRISDNIKRWNHDRSACLNFMNSDGIRIWGEGTIDGQGLKWWQLAYLGTDFRRNLIGFGVSRDIEVSGITLLSSPKFSISFSDCVDIVVHDITIFIDSSVTRFGRESVTYALNTDGIDIAAYNVTVYNNNITNYDDAIVAKPCHASGILCQCSGEILAYNNNITYSTGLSVGSVSPDNDTRCVRNVVFRDNHMYRPLKAIYVKSNPGDEGNGIIENILYENIRIEQALWWTVWIGPQQMNQPGSDPSRGCNFLFPFVPDCDTQPLVTIRNVTLRNVVATETLPLFEGPGVVLCDAANPCTDIVFDGVTNSMFTGNVTDIIAQLPIHLPYFGLFPTDMRTDDWEFEYLVTNAYGENLEPVQPAMCFDPECYWKKPTGVTAADKRLKV